MCASVGCGRAGGGGGYRASGKGGWTCATQPERSDTACGARAGTRNRNRALTGDCDAELVREIVLGG
eukprot:5505550-Pleurochrysis_carterae.AAC.1